MKRTLLVLLLPFLLAGCAQLFDANLYGTIDVPPPLNAGALKNASVEEIKNQMTDDSFFERLKDDPAALDSLQEGLEPKFNTVTTGSSEAEKTAAVDAATTYVLVTAKSTEVGALVSDVAANLPSIADSLKNNDFSGALDSFLGNKNETEIAKTLTDLVAMADALDKMQTAATSGTAVDSVAFFAGTEDPVGFSQLALLAAAAKALTSDNTSIQVTAAALAAGTSLSNSGTSLTNFANALDGTATTANPYAYLGAVKDQLPVSL